MKAFINYVECFLYIILVSDEFCACFPENTNIKSHEEAVIESKDTYYLLLL